jgi:hypothetical protein
MHDAGDIMPNMKSCETRLLITEMLKSTYAQNKTSSQGVWLQLGR